VIGQAIVLIGIDPEFLLMVLALNAAQLIVLVAIFKVGPVDGKKIFIMKDILGIYIVEIALAKGKVIYCIQDIRFACAVIANKTIYLL
jgi:hypothetical protein